MLQKFVLLLKIEVLVSLADFHLLVKILMLRIAWVRDFSQAIWSCFCIKKAYVHLEFFLLRIVNLWLPWLGFTMTWHGRIPLLTQWPFESCSFNITFALTASSIASILVAYSTECLLLHNSTSELRFLFQWSVLDLVLNLSLAVEWWLSLQGFRVCHIKFSQVECSPTNDQSWLRIIGSSLVDVNQTLFGDHRRMWLPSYSAVVGEIRAESLVVRRSILQVATTIVVYFVAELG